MASGRRSAGKCVPRGSVGTCLKACKTLAVGFDVTTQTCHVLPEIEPLKMSSWEVATLYKVFYNVLDKNDVLKTKSGKKSSRSVSKWATKFAKFGMTWQNLLDGSPTEVLSRIISGLPFYELPCGQMKVQDWSQAHVPSVLWLLYRGLPDGKRKDKGEDALLDEWKKHILKSLKAADHMKQGSEDKPHGIKNFDLFTSTRWILQPEDKHGEVKRHLDVVRVVKDMREFLLANELYLRALDDLHAGLMADLAGRWYCDYYDLHGPSVFYW